MTSSDDLRRRWLALYVLCTGVLMIVLDATIVNVALPSIKDDLDFSQSNLTWVVNAYLIAFGGLLLLAGRLGDLLGQRRIFLVGLGVFTAASLVCGLADSQAVLVGARFVQGAGGALTSAVVLGMIVTMFPQGGEQAKAIGVYGFVASAGGAIGLLLGGVLTDVVNWHWIFFVNVPVGIATAIGARRLVAPSPGLGLDAGTDIPGAALMTGGLMLGVYDILEADRAGWGSARTIGLGAAAIALIVAFLVRQDRVATPLMPLRLLRVKNVASANTMQALLVVAMFGTFFLGALYLQGVLGYSALEVGLAFLPSSVGMCFMSLRGAEWLTRRFGQRTTVLSALSLITVAVLLLARTPADGDYVVDIFPAVVLMGLGAGMSFPPLMTMAMTGVELEDTGLASGLVSTSVQVGGAIGLAILTALSTQRTGALRHGGESAQAALNGGYHLAYLVAAGFLLVAIVVAVWSMRPAASAQQASVGTVAEVA